MTNILHVTHLHTLHYKGHKNGSSKQPHQMKSEFQMKTINFPINYKTNRNV